MLTGCAGQGAVLVSASRSTVWPRVQQRSRREVRPAPGAVMEVS